MKLAFAILVAALLLQFAISILILMLLPAYAEAAQTCTTSTFSGVTTTTCSSPRLVCKSSTFAGVTRTRCSK